MLGSVLLASAAILAAMDDSSPSRQNAGSAERMPAGIALFSSSIGGDVSLREITAFVKHHRINLVVIDCAWITHHWPQTKLAEVERLARALRANGVSVAAMYRPRGLSPSDAQVHWARESDGTVAQDHVGLCFAHADSVRWGAAWGDKIVKAWPSIDRIILYNVTAQCQCERCRDGQGTKHAQAFVQTCRDQWRKLRPSIKVGHVGTADEYVDAVDFLCPFLALNRRQEEVPVDTRLLVSQFDALRRLPSRKPIVPLIKVCWNDETRNDAQDIIHAMDDCRREGFGFILWYYEWIFRGQPGRYDQSSILAALGTGGSKVREPSPPKSQ